MNVVEVLWGDAWVDTDDYRLSTAKKSAPVYRRSVGFLVTNNDHGLVIASDIYEKNKKEVNTVMFIPHGMIVDWWEYK